MVSKNSAAYIEELENKIVDLSIKLKRKSNDLKNVEYENYERIRKLAHNLKNPVGVAFSFTEMIAENMEHISKEKLAKFNGIIQNSLLFSIEILNTIATLNRLKSPDFSLNYTTVNYVAFLDEILNEVKPDFELKNIEIIKNFPVNSLKLDIDTSEIKMVILNLLSNALRFSPKNSVLTIAFTETKDMVETLISDQGIGISECDIPMVFNEFFVVNTYCENKQKCVGLGLSVVKLIVNYHKGKILVEKNIERGVSFKLALPKKIA